MKSVQTYCKEKGVRTWCNLVFLIVCIYYIIYYCYFYLLIHSSFAPCKVLVSAVVVVVVGRGTTSLGREWVLVAISAM